MKNKFVWSIVCASIPALIGTSALADDTEVFFGTSSSTTSGNPNILLVLDTSGSMTSTITSPVAYDPSGTYSGSCDSTKVYFKQGSYSSKDKCSSLSSVPIDSATFKCGGATAALNGGVGFYSDTAIRWRYKNGNYQWSATFSGGSGYNYTNDITCLSNNGPSVYPYSGTSGKVGDKYSGTVNDNYWKNGQQTQFVFYSAKYLNYLNGNTTTTQSRLQIVKTAASNLIDSITNVNIGLMRYSSTGTGGMVLAPVQSVSTGATILKTAINGMHACGDTPLSETLYEAYRYYSGGNVLYGNSSYVSNVDSSNATCIDTTSTKSVADSRTPANIASASYKSPIATSCQKNYVVYLTDGLANNDTSADTNIKALGTTCYSTQAKMWGSLGVTEPSEGHSGGLCLKALSKYMNDNDLSGSLSDKQSVITYFIGFGDDVAKGAAEAYLSDAAKAGGGEAVTATDLGSLTSQLQQIVGAIKDDSASFTSPSVAVNSFNKTQVLEDMYVSMFKPTTTAHWPGNLKKFKFRDGMIVGSDGTNAVDSKSGFFTSQARDFWQQTTDTGTDTTTKGGAANRIPAPDPLASGHRNVYTYLGSNKPTSAAALSGFPITTSNTAITSGLLKIGAPSDPSRDVLINWARGDDDGDLVTTPSDIRHQMGDPVHSQPAVVIYGNNGSSETDKLNDAVVYVATNDGYLHAIDVSTGTELWSYIPQELLEQLKLLYADDTTANNKKHYSLDGDIRILKYDVDANGMIDGADDRVYLYVSQGRGGDRYYALDVTNKNNPKFMWSLGKGDLGGIVDKSWSKPTLGRIRVGSGNGQNSQNFVLIFGGGYDDYEDSISYNTSDSFGNGIFIVDARFGTLLWYAGPTTNTGANLKLAAMTHAIPSSVTVLDTNNDGWTDRIYVGDMAGQVWRFDITNGNPASSLVAGGVIASLGGKISATDANNRSFYNPPDLSFFTVKGSSNYYNVAIGSGDRGLPKSNTVTQDRFYSIRDYQLASMTQSQYNALAPIKDSNLTTINGNSAVDIASGAPGWRLPLSSAEKVLAASVTLEGTVMFTTFVPGGGASGCKPSAGLSRAYSVNVSSGLKPFNSLYEEFSTTGLPPQIAMIDTNKLVQTGSTSSSSSSSSSNSSGSSGSSSSSSSSDDETKSLCLSGVTILNNCVDTKSKIKTFWRELGAN